ncbi:MAG: hypothetical protein QOF71_1292 [Candidatus Eremiobacteraeota bacterium]|jgi:hypothetical protein|nr:hypothetical protein [Candidatus Eremiobacteraeota bacterium]
MQNALIMLGRTAVIASLIAVASCSPANGRDATACDAVHLTAAAESRCAADAQRTETRADHTAGLEHAEALARAASEWRKSASGRGVLTPEARRRLAHAMVLDERVQDDPGAPAALRAQAKRDEELARTALLRTR